MKDENVNNSGTSNETAVIPKIVIFKAYITNQSYSINSFNPSKM